MIRKPLYFASIAGAALLALSLVTAPTPASAQCPQEAGNPHRICDFDGSDNLIFAAPEFGVNSHPTLVGSTGDDFSDSPRAEAQFEADPTGETNVNGFFVPSPANNNPDTVRTWLAGLLGVDEADIPFAFQPNDGTIQTPTTPNQFSGTVPANWVYAVVNPDNFYAVYKNTAGAANELITDFFSHGISHITFFVPLPAAAWLFLSALAGLFGFRWWRGRDEQPATA